MRSMVCAALSTCIFCAISVAHADDTPNYAYAWPLTTNSDSAAWQIEPSAEIYGVSADAQLRDLEVVDGEGNPVPMALRETESATTPANWIELPLFVLPPAKGAGGDDGAVSLRIERGADGRLRSLDAGVNPAVATPAATDDFILDASKLDGPIDALRVDWDATSEAVNAQFSITGSDDLQNWHSLKSSASILGLTQGSKQLSRHEIPIGGARVAYLRLHRLDNGAALAGMHLSARTVASSTPLRAARQWLIASPVTIDRLHDKVPPGSAVYRYVLPAAVSADALKLELASDNSIANVRIENRNGSNSTWLQRTAFTAFRLRQMESVIGNDEVDVATGPRSDEWRVEATPPLDHAPSLSVAWHPARFIFLAQGHGPYRLIAGSAAARRADYPVDIALSELRSRLGKDWQPPLAALGVRTTLAGVEALKPAAAPEKPHDWKTWLLWAVLVGAAALIGYLALSLLRQPKSIE
jgi:Protein of unknown function (DUF3999)